MHAWVTPIVTPPRIMIASVISVIEDKASSCDAVKQTKHERDDAPPKYLLLGMHKTL